MIPYEDITFAMVVWNDEERARKLLDWVRPWFKTVAVVVQESPDNTLAVVSERADIVVTDRHHGFGDASFGPLLLPRIKTTWTFKVDCDEWPDEELLASLGEAVALANAKPTKGVWIQFYSFTEGLEYKQQHAHLRLFHTRLGWPGTLHSRPPVEDGFIFHLGHLTHTRSLDEMMRDYLRYYRVGLANEGWTDHNRLMMRSACIGVADDKGWAFVKSHGWWSDVLAAAFAGEDPE